MHATTDKDGSTPYLPATTGRRLQPPSFISCYSKMLQHPIYKLLLEGGHNPCRRVAFPSTTLPPQFFDLYLLLLLH